jgi:DNA-binding transcriptional regulator YdaS (Cro superfamily)
MSYLLLKRAAQVVGSAAALARAIGVTPQFMSEMMKEGGRPMPVKYMPGVEFVTGGQVPCEELGPAVRWVRVPDESWPHQGGRPLQDFEVPAAAAASQTAAA